jgi:hypothetical protein
MKPPTINRNETTHIVESTASFKAMKPPTIKRNETTHIVETTASFKAMKPPTIKRNETIQVVETTASSKMKRSRLYPINQSVFAVGALSCLLNMLASSGDRLVPMTRFFKVFVTICGGDNAQLKYVLRPGSLPNETQTYT